MKNLKVGDIIVSAHRGEAKVLEVLTNTFLRSGWDDFEGGGNWWTFTEAEKAGWKIKGSEEKRVIKTWDAQMTYETDTIRIIDGKKYKLIEE